MNFSGQMKKRVAILLAIVLFLSAFYSICQDDEAKAAETIEIAVDTSTREGIDKTDIKIQPDNYDTQTELANAGVTNLNISLNISSFSSNNAGTAGIMIYFWDGSNWMNQWYNLSNGEMNLTFDISSYLAGNQEVNYGIQFSNISSVTFNITSASLSIDGNSSSASSSFENVEVENNYAKLLELSLYLYDANMCGNDVESDSGLDWRGNCHTYDESVSYKGQIVDVSGGFHDAGDHVKFGLPGAYTATILGMSYLEFKDAYSKTGTKSHFQRISDHFAKYFKKCIIRDQNTNDVIAFVYQCGNGNTDHSYLGIPELQSQSQRGGVYFADSSTPATDQIGEAVAALTLHYLNFNDETYLQAAKDLFAFARANSKGLAPSSETAGFYKSESSKWQDDYCLAAALLYKATKESTYLSEYNTYKNDLNIYNWISWDGVDSLAKFYGEGDYSALKTAYANMQKEGTLLDSRFRVISDWGSARYNCIIQMLGLLYDKYSGSNTEANWAKVQMDYILGNNSFNKCFVVGYSENSSKNPHHRASYGYDDFPSGNMSQKHSLIGALVGGPKTNNEYNDNTSDYVCNEVALDYNAGLVFSAAALYLANQDDGNQSLVEPSSLSGVKATETLDASCIVNIISSGGTASPTATPTATPTASPTATPTGSNNTSGENVYKPITIGDLETPTDNTSNLLNQTSNSNEATKVKVTGLKIKIAKKWKKGKKYKLYASAKINGKKYKITKKVLKKFKLKIKWSVSSKKKAKISGKKSPNPKIKMKKKGTVVVKCKIASKLAKKKLKRKK